MDKKILNGALSKIFSIRFSVALLTLAILSGCSYSHSRGDNPVKLIKEPRIKFEVKPNMEITLNALPGELIIKGIGGTEAVASMALRCPQLTGSCADHFADQEFELKRVSNNLTLGSNKRALYMTNNSVKTTLSLPRTDRLVVKMIAGSIKISSIGVQQLDVDMEAGGVDIIVDQLNTLKVDLEAGDVNISIPEDVVAEVDIDAGVGDASIRMGGRNEEVPRSLLVGAQIKKQFSKDGAVIKVDVQFGDITVNLTK